MKKKYIATVLGCLMLFPCCAAPMHGHYVSRSQDGMAAFQALRVEGNIEVDFMQQPKVSVHVSGPEKLVEHAVIRSQGGILVLQFVPPGVLSSSQKLRITVTGPVLERVDITGDSEVRLRGPLQGRQLVLSLAEEADFAADSVTLQTLHLQATDRSEIDINRLDARQVQAVSFGRAEMELSGLALKASFENNGAGEIDAADLRVQQAEAVVKGKGDIRVSAYESLIAAVFGKGRIKYKGAPVSIQRSGNVRRVLHDQDD
ncbi:MAG: DUF2807 domain-containing protein [Elusimicrobiaceae bacterium]|nr:DUF2807 domain-containing protein [Elusimicrobiaceae bacterium]